MCSSKIVDNNCACVTAQHLVIFSAIRSIDDAVVMLPLNISPFCNTSDSAIYSNFFMQFNCYV